MILWEFLFHFYIRFLKVGIYNDDSVNYTFEHYRIKNNGNDGVEHIYGRYWSARVWRVDTVGQVQEYQGLIYTFIYL
jgi:hypothetical protein